MGNWLQIFRRAFAGSFFLLILLYSIGFLFDFLQFDLSTLAKIQFVPALLSGTFVVVLLILFFTAFFGRWYCSFFCPLGVFQDLLARLKKRSVKKICRKTTVVRYSILCLSILALSTGTTFILLLVDPWSVFSRLTTTLALPPLTFANNILFELLHYFGFYGVEAKEYTLVGSSVLLVSLVTFFLLCYFVYFRGSRSWCNTLCPVGTFLNVAARKSLLRIKISRTKCTRCGLCEKVCKAGVIEAKEMKIRSADCVCCFNCLPVCRDDAISYGLMGKKR